MRTVYYDTMALPPCTVYPLATEEWMCDRCGALGYRWADTEPDVVRSRIVGCGEDAHPNPNDPLAGTGHGWRRRSPTR